MENLVYFKANPLDIHKKTMDKNYQRKNVGERANNFKDLRRQTRDQILLRRRKINEKNFSPYITPDANKPKIKYVNNQKKKNTVVTDDKAEKLKKWKAEKERRKIEEKKNMKPLFKICRVRAELGLPDMNKVIKEIKGKPIKPIYKSLFAPKNHIFQPPKNVKTIHFIKEKSTPCNNKENLTSNRKRAQIKSVDKNSVSKCCTSDRKILRPENGSVKKRIAPAKESKVHKNVWKVKDNKLCTNNQKIMSSLNNKINKEVISNADVVVDPTKSGSSKQNSSNKSVTDSGKCRRVRIEEEPILIEDTILETFSKSPSDSKQCETIYSDDEISFRTPKKKDTTSSTRKSKRSTPFPKFVNISHSKDGSFESRQLYRRAQKSSTSSSKLLEGDSSYAEELRADKVALPDGHSSKEREPENEQNRRTPKNNNLAKKLSVISGGIKSKRKSGSVRSSKSAKKRISSVAMSPEDAAEHFTKILDDEIARIEENCSKWETYKTDNDLTEEAQGMITGEVGHSRLLIAKKFSRFRVLIEECRSGLFTGKPITSEDLQGYWDSAFIQVVDLDKRFEHLDKVKQNGWQEVVLEKKVVPKKVVPKKVKREPKKKIGSSKLRDAIKAARNKKQEVDESCDTNFITHAKGNTSVKFSGVATPGKNKRLSRSVNSRRSRKISLVNVKSPTKQNLFNQPCL